MLETLQALVHIVAYSKVYCMKAYNAYFKYLYDYAG